MDTVLILHIESLNSDVLQELLEQYQFEDRFGLSKCKDKIDVITNILKKRKLLCK